MSSANLSIESIQSGALVREINKELERLGQDVLARPRVKKPRILTVQISLRPEWEPSSDRLMPKVGSSLSTKVPGWAGLETLAYVENGRIMVNKDFPESGRTGEQALPHMGAEKKD